MSAHSKAILQTLGVVLLGSLASVLAKLSLSQVSPVSFVWLQYAIGGTALSAYTFLWRKERLPVKLDWRIWAGIVWLGLANFTICRVLFLLALHKIPATTYVYLINFAGIVTMLMSVFMLKEHPSLFQFAGAVIAIAGLRLFFQAVPPPSEIQGLVYVGIAIFALATTNNVARKLGTMTGQKISIAMISTLALWIGGLPVVAYGLITDTPPAVTGWRNWAIIGLNGVVTIALGLTVWNYILKTLRSYEASILASTSVIFTALWALPILGESLSLTKVFGIATMMFGMALVQIRRP